MSRSPLRARARGVPPVSVVAVAGGAALATHLLDSCHDIRTVQELLGHILSLEAPDFVQRFLLHVLPRGFVRVRHFGLQANGCRSRLIARVRQAAPCTRTPTARQYPSRVLAGPLSPPHRARSRPLPLLQPRHPTPRRDGSSGRTRERTTTAEHSNKRSTSSLEHDPSASKSPHGPEAAARAIRHRGAHRSPAIRPFLRDSSAPPQTPHPRPLHQTSGVQSPYPRKAAV